MTKEEFIKFVEKNIGGSIPDYIGFDADQILNMINIHGESIIDSIIKSIKDEIKIRELVKSGVDFEDALNSVMLNKQD